MHLMKKIFLFFIFYLSNYYSSAQNRYDIVIDELMPDPTPIVTIPSVEWIEIKNTTTATINLLGWKVSNNTSTSGAMASYNLKPDSFLIICTGSSVPLLSVYGPTLSVTSFPSLGNDGDIISIKNSVGKTIHCVAYTMDWYQNAVKKDGGWSLEMIDTKNPCGGIDNWKASIDSKGATPGNKNSVDAINVDNKPPQLLKTYTNTPTQIVAVFNEPVDSTTAAISTNYTFSNGISIISALPQAPLFQTVILNLNTAIVNNTVYNLTVNSVTDCKGNSIGTFNKARNGLPVDADSLNMVVNEILFNPKSGGFDYAEFYNNSNKIFDANKLFIANLNTGGVIANVKKLSETPNLIFPGDFITITESAININQNFIVANTDWLIEIPTMPSMNDDEGNVILLNFQGKIIDQVKYKDGWHFKLIDNKEGISLERIDYNLPSQKAETWHSASFASGFGTPTAKNSQFKTGNFADGEISVSPKTFSPDNDGMDDVLSILYSFNDRGYLANVLIYDASGILVKQLKKGDLLAFKGSWIWDGLNDKNEKLATGIYVIYTEVYDLQGKRKKFKNTVVLARKLN